MSPPNQLHGQSSADDEAKRKEQAAMMAMRDDLGIARVEELPLNDEPRGHDRDDRRGRGGGANDRRRPLPLAAPQPPQRAATRVNTGAAGWNFGQAWQDAIASGAFDDDDAQGVKGLNDLGGGRIYDKAVNSTMRILEQRSKRTGHQVELAAPKKKARTDDPGRSHIHNIFASAVRQFVSQTRASSSQGSVPPSKSKAKPPKLTPMSRPARQRPPPPRAVPSLGVPVPEMVVDPNAPLSFELGNVIFKVSVRFSSRDITPAQPALVLLSSAKKPELGFFTVVIFNRKYCQWPISAWHDYATGAEHLLGVTFLDAGSFQGYEIYFPNDNELMEFMSRVRALLAGEYLDQAESALIPASTINNAPTVAAAPVVNSSIGTPGRQPTLLEAQAVPATLATPATRATPAAPAPSDVQQSTRMTQRAASSLAGVIEWANPPPASDNVMSATATENGTTPKEPICTSSQESRPVQLAGELQQNLQLEDELSNASTTTSQIGSDELLSREDLILTARHIFSVFLCQYRDTMMAQEWDQVAEGIRAGMMEQMLSGARAKGFSDRRIQALRDAVQEAFDTEIKVNRMARQAVTNGNVDPESRVNGAARPESPDRTQPSRIQYSAQQLLSMRHAAVSPSKDLAKIPYLPKRGEGSRQPSTPYRGPYRAVSSGVARSSPGPATTQTGVLKAAGAMDWVLGKTTTPQRMPESSKSAGEAPEPTSEKAPAAASSATGPSAPRDVGLGCSRWATGSSEVKNANAFTGPAYEKAWSKRSYLQDLAQLDPQTRVTAAAEDLMDLYFPIPYDSPSEPQPSANDDRQEPVAAVPGSGAATPTRSDKIENLRERISRLSIWSPTSAPQRPSWAPAPAQPSSPVVQASRDLWTVQTTSAGSTQPASTSAAHAPAVQNSSQPSSSPLAQSAGLASAIPPRVSSLQSNSTVATQSTSAPAQTRMASLNAASSSSPAQSSTLTAMQSPRLAQPQASSVPTPQSVPQTSRQSSSTSATQTTSQAQPQSSSTSVPQPGAPPRSRMNSLHAAPFSVPDQTSILTAAQSSRTAPPQSPSVSTPQTASRAQPQSSSTSAPQPASQAAPPRPRGLAASRHACGSGPSSSGNFKFIVPKE